MFYRKDVVLMAVAGLLASSGYAMAETKSGLSLDPTVLTAQDAAEPAPLMGTLAKAGVTNEAMQGFNIYGWLEAGYTFNNRHGSQGNGPTGLIPGPFNHEAGNHFMMNQFTLRFERVIADPSKFDVGGMVEITYGTDASFLHSSGMPFNGADPSSTAPPTATSQKYNAEYEFDVTQAYVEVSVAGMKFKVGKFLTLLGYETVDPRGNAFYSHSYSFGALPFTQTGVLGTFAINEQLTVTAGVTRGWDQTLEDAGPDGGVRALDALGNFVWTPNKQTTAIFNWSLGPQNFNDDSHYRAVINPIVIYQATEQLKIGLEGLYIYDGGMNGDVATGGTVSHAYGDIWAVDVYAAYTLNEYITLNTRLEKYHTSSTTWGPVVAPAGGSLSIYSITLGATIVPLPGDGLGKNISIRPEIRYDFTDSSNGPYPAYGRTFKDQLTFAADVIVKF